MTTIVLVVGDPDDAAGWSWIDVVSRRPIIYELTCGMLIMDVKSLNLFADVATDDDHRFMRPNTSSF